MKPCIPPDFYSLQEGYPYRMEGGRKVYVVREILEQKLGRKLTSDELALNNCDVKGCLEPEHIYLGDRRERVAKSVRAGLHSRGSSRPTSKLTESDISEIYTRLEADEPGTSIALDYNVHKSQISRIKNKQTWKHIERGDYE